MPVIEIKQNTLLDSLGEYDRETLNDPSMGQVVKAGLVDNLAYQAGIAVTMGTQSFEPDANYDVFSDLRGYEQYADRFIGVENNLEASIIKEKIDFEGNARQTMASASGLQSVAAFGVGVGLDPLTYIPVAGTAYKTYRTGGRILEGAAKTAGVGLGMAVAQEVGLQAMQETRSAGESFTNIAATTFLSGIVGAAAGAIGNRAQFDELAKRVDDELTVPYAGESTVGAASVKKTSFEQEQLKGALGMEKHMAFQDPVLRLLNSPSRETMTMSEKLAETYLLKNKHDDFVASEISVENMIKSYNLPKYTFFKNMDSAFLKYREKEGFAAKTRVKVGDKVDAVAAKFGRSRADGKLTYNEFSVEVVKAARRNDVHAIPEVAEAAAALRRDVFDPIFKRGQEVGVFGEDVPQVSTAPSYVTRLWKREKISADMPRFKEINKQWMMKRRDEQAASLPDKEKAINQSKGNIKQIRKEIGIVSGQASKAAFDEMSKAVKTELTETISVEDFKEAFLNSLNKVDTPEQEAARLQARIDRQVRKAVKDMFGEQTKKQLDDIEMELRNDTFDMVKQYGDDLDDLGIQASDLYREISEEAGLLSGQPIEINMKALEDAITQDILSKVGAAAQASGRSIDPDKLDAIVQKKFNNFVTRKSNQAGNAAGKKSGKEATTDLREKLKVAVKDLLDKKKDFSRTQFKSRTEDAEIDDVVNELTNRILGTPAGRLPYDFKMQADGPKVPANKAQLRGAARSRVYDIPDEMVEDFLVNDVETIVESYSRSLGADIELMRKFGTVDETVPIKSIESDYGKLMAQARADLSKEFEGDDLAQKLAKSELDLTRKMRADIRDFKAIWQRLRGTYALPDDYASPLNSIERTALNLNYVRLLGGMTISAFTDVARPVMAHGLGNVFKHGIGSMARSWKGFRAAAEDVKEAGTALDMVLDTRARAQAGTDEIVEFSNRVESTTSNVARGFGVLALMSPWNAAMKQFSGVITQARMVQAAMDLAGGKQIGQKEITNLAANFIDEKMALRIAEQFKKFGQQSDVLIPNVRAWDDLQAADVFRAAVRREVDSIIVTPGQDKPLWMSKPGWRLLGQFRSFAFASTQRTMLSALQKRDMDVMNGAALSFFLGMGVYAMKEMNAGRELSDDPKIWITEGIDRSGLTAWFMDANNIVEKVSRGRLGMNALAGGPPMSRYASRSVLEAILGATYGAMGDVAEKLTGAAFTGEWRASDTATVRKLMPYQNLFYMRSIFDEAEENINAAFGVKGSKK